MRPATRALCATIASLLVLAAVQLPRAAAAREQDSVSIHVEQSGVGTTELNMAVEEKSSWPELLNRPVAEAKAVIEQEAPGVKVIQVPTGSMVTMDYNTMRVWLWEEGGKVAQVPMRG